MAAEYLEVTWKAVGILVACVGVVSAAVSAFLTHILTMAKVRKDLVDHPGLAKTIKDCRKVCNLAMDKLESKQSMSMEALDQKHSFCSANVEEKFEEQNKLLIEHTRMLEKGDDEFTALRLNFGVLIDALDIPEAKRKQARAKIENIRKTVLNDRKP